jgi:hypothetical protein
MDTIQVFCGVSRTVPSSSLRVARALKDGGMSIVETLRALRRMYGFDLESARGVCWGVCPSNVWRPTVKRFNPDSRVFTDAIVHGDGWWFCRDNFSAWENHWVSLPQEQLRSSGRDLLF